MLVKFIVHKDFGVSRRANVEIVPFDDETPANHAVVHVYGASGWVYEDSLTEPHAEPHRAVPGAIGGQDPTGAIRKDPEAASTASRPSGGEPGG